MTRLIRPATWTAAVAVALLLVGAAAARWRAPVASAPPPPPEVSGLTLVPQTVTPRLEDTFVRAEISGRAGRAQLELGARVTGSGDLLTTVEQVDPIYVNFSPSDEDLLGLRRDIADGRLLMPPAPRALAVQVTLADGSLLPAAGELNFADLALQPATGTLQLRAQLKNPQHILLPGQFVRVRLLGLKRPSAILVPQRAVQQGLGGAFVYVVGDSGKVAARDVVATSWDAGSWLIEHGLQPGDRAVVDGVQKVAPGQPARPVAYRPAADSAASDGVMTRPVFSDVPRTPDRAGVDVKNQIAVAEPQLPQEVVRNGITVRKRQTAFLVVLALSSDDPRYDTEYLNNYAKIYIDDELKRLPGVGDASTFGQLDFSMLLSLDPDRMAQLGLTVSDVAAAVQEQNATKI